MHPGGMSMQQGPRHSPGAPSGATPRMDGESAPRHSQVNRPRAPQMRLGGIRPKATEPEPEQPDEPETGAKPTIKFNLGGAKPQGERIIFCVAVKYV